jgi:opacity protein-like surface antigen
VALLRNWRAAFAGEGAAACSPFVGCVSQTKNVVGWTAGVEYMFWHALSFKLEYLHVDLGRQSFPNAPTSIPGVFLIPSRAMSL